MVGFLGAIAGGAMKGWSAGTLQEIKDKREEKLALLDREFQRSENALTRGVQEKQIASQEKLTLSSQALQERLGNLQAQTSKDVANIGETGATARTQAQIDANRHIADLQRTTQLDLNIKPVLQTDGSTVWMRGNEVMHIVDPKTGKEIDPVITDTDTDQMRNYKYLASIGVDPGEAKAIAFDTGRDAAELKTSLYNNLLKTRVGDFGTADDEDETWARNKTEEVWRSFKPQAAPAPATPAEPAAVDTAPATSSGATAAPDTTTVPHETLLKQAVDGVNNGTLKREDVRKKLLQKGVPEAKIKAAGL